MGSIYVTRRIGYLPCVLSGYEHNKPVHRGPKLRGANLWLTSFTLPQIHATQFGPMTGALAHHETEGVFKDKILNAII